MNDLYQHSNWDRPAYLPFIGLFYLARTKFGRTNYDIL